MTDYQRPFAYQPGRKPAPPSANGHAQPTAAPRIDAADDSSLSLDNFTGASLAGIDVPPREWLVPDRIPARVVTLLAGDGGIGKSLLALQLGVAVATASDWIGMLPEPGGVLYISCEDDKNEVHRRLADIVDAQAFDMADLSDLHVISLAGKDAALGVTKAKTGIVEPTKLWLSICRLIAEIRPKLVIIDILADVFVGNENSRPEARQFIGMLRKPCIEHDLSVVLLSHPSLSGMTTGTGTSGSTGWNNSVRSRMYFDRPKGDDGQPDKDRRVLKFMKANYGPLGDEVVLFWERGRFKPAIGVGGFDKAVRADSQFLAMLAKFAEQDRNVSDKSGASYAPAVFGTHPDACGVTKNEFRSAMERLFGAGKIKVIKIGPPSRQLRSIVFADETAASDEPSDG